MVADDHNYLSGMASVALAVLMVIVMFWIRSQIPDDTTPGEPLPIESATANATVNSHHATPAHNAIALGSVQVAVAR